MDFRLVCVTRKDWKETHREINCFLHFEIFEIQVHQNLFANGLFLSKD